MKRFLNFFHVGFIRGKGSDFVDAECQSTETSIAKTDLEASMDDSERYNLTLTCYRKSSLAVSFCFPNADHVLIPKGAAFFTFCTCICACKL